MIDFDIFYETLETIQTQTLSIFNDLPNFIVFFLRFLGIYQFTLSTEPILNRNFTYLNVSVKFDSNAGNVLYDDIISSSKEIVPMMEFHVNMVSQRKCTHLLFYPGAIFAGWKGTLLHQ